MSAFPRRSRGTSPDDPMLTQHQAFIRSLPCLRCGKPAPSECASVGMLPGLGILPGYWYLVPLCGPTTVWQDCCHSRKHYRGSARFWSELGIDPFDLVLQLWRISGDVTAGFHAVTRARQAAMASRPRRSWGEAMSSPRSALNRSAALRARLRPTVIVTSPSRSELPLLLESRS